MLANSRVLAVLKIDAFNLLGSLPQADLDFKPADVEQSNGFKRVDELPEFSDDVFAEWRNSPPLDINEIPETSVDVLAWYQPFSNYGPAAWGIHFDTVKMNQHAQRVYRAAKKIRPGIKPSTVVSVVWDEVMRHEREHAVQEITLAALIEAGLHPPLDTNSVYAQSKDSMEALATHYEHTDAVYRNPSNNIIDRKFVCHMTSKMKKPPGYQDWDQVDLDSEAKISYRLSIAPEIALEVAARLRKLVWKVKDNNYIEIPIYIC